MQFWITQVLPTNVWNKIFSIWKHFIATYKEASVHLHNIDMHVRSVIFV